MILRGLLIHDIEWVGSSIPSHAFVDIQCQMRLELHYEGIDWRFTMKLSAPIYRYDYTPHCIWNPAYRHISSYIIFIHIYMILYASVATRIWFLQHSMPSGPIKLHHHTWEAASHKTVWFMSVLFTPQNPPQMLHVSCGGGQQWVGWTMQCMKNVLPRVSPSPRCMWLRTLCNRRG